MPEAPGTPSSIRCAACGFENTATSLYCQDCGLRLVPPSSAASGEPSAPSAPPAATPVRSRPRILSTQRATRATSYLVIALRTLVLAALAALIVQILRPPDGVPPADPPLSGDIVNNVRALLQRSADHGGVIPATWSANGLNAYLAAVLQPGKPGFLGAAFERALLAPAGEGFTLFVERKIAGLTLYSAITYHLVARGNGIGLVADRAAFGRLPLPAAAAPVILSMSGGLDQALSSELELLRGAKNVRITPQKAFVDFGPPRP